MSWSVASALTNKRGGQGRSRDVLQRCANFTEKQLITDYKSTTTFCTFSKSVRIVLKSSALACCFIAFIIERSSSSRLTE